VPRDADAAGSGVRARVAAAAEQGGFVLLVGGSSVGKTRCAAEALMALLPDWACDEDWCRILRVTAQGVPGSCALGVDGPHRVDATQ